MKRTAKILIYFVIVAHVILLVGCKTKQAVVPTNTVYSEKTITLHERDTVFEVQADSSFYQAWIECVNNKPVLRNPVTVAGQNRLSIPEVSLSAEGRLDVECRAENLELKARIRELTTELSTQTTEYIPVEVVKPLTFIQKLFITLGKVFGVLLIIAIGYGAFKIYQNVK